MHPNIEVKARGDNLRRVKELALLAGALPNGILVQTDTYFDVPRGRLKLRETLGPEAQLIWYERPDRAMARESRYQLVTVTDPAGLIAALSAAVGVRGRVSKRRELLLWHNVRIHLDEVMGLGSYLELEAVVSDDAPPALSRTRIEDLCQRLEIRPQDHIAVSYSDLLGL